MKKIGSEFRFLAPGAEKALFPLWIRVTELLSNESSDFDTVFWTTDCIGAVLAVRTTSAGNEEIAPKNDMTYSTPEIAGALKVMEQMYKDDFCDDTLGPFRKVYESWVDYLILLAFNAPKVRKAFEKVPNAKRNIHVVSSTVDEGLSGKLRVLFPSELLKATKLPRTPTKKKRRSK